MSEPILTTAQSQAQYSLICSKSETLQILFEQEYTRVSKDRLWFNFSPAEFLGEYRSVEQYAWLQDLKAATQQRPHFAVFGTDCLPWLYPIAVTHSEGLGELAQNESVEQNAISHLLQTLVSLGFTHFALPYEVAHQDIAFMELAKWRTNHQLPYLMLYDTKCLYVPQEDELYTNNLITKGGVNIGAVRSLQHELRLRKQIKDIVSWANTPKALNCLLQVAI